MTDDKARTAISSHFLPPAWLAGPWGVLGIITILYIFVNLAWTYFHWGGPERVTLLANLYSFFPSLVAAVIAWRVTATKELFIALRRAWFLLGMSFFMFFIGNVVWAYLELVLEVEPFPSLADIFYLAAYPFALWGLLSMPSLQQSRRERLTLWLDLLCILTAAVMFVGYFIIVPTAAVSSPDLLTQLLAPAYPLGSLLVIGGVLVILYRPASPNTLSALGLLLLGMLFFVGSDFAFGYTSLTGTYVVGGWTDVGWNVAQLFFALAALRQQYLGPPSATSRLLIAGLNKLDRWLPPISMALGYALVLYVLIARYSQAAEWLMAGALLLTLLVTTRQIISPAFADLPVRVKMIITFAVVSVLSVSLVTTMSYLAIRSNLERALGAHLKEDVEIRSQTLGNELSKQLDLLEGFVLSETIENGASAASGSYSDDPAVIQAQLQEQDQAWRAASASDALVQGALNNPVAKELGSFLQKFPPYTRILITDRYGATIAATARPENYYHAMQDWWQAAFNDGHGAIYIGPVTFDSAAHAPSVIIAMPVYADLKTEVVGVIYTYYNLQNVLKVLILSPSDTVHTGFQVLLPGAQVITPQSEITSLDPDTVDRLRASQGTDYAQISFEGKLQLISASPVVAPNPKDAEIFQDLNWVLVTHEDPGVAFAPLHDAGRIALLTMLLALLLTGGVAVILARALMAPISRLTQVAAQIAAGDLSGKAQVESQDEIGMLASTFNSMLDGLARARQEVQESEALYRSLVEYSPDMITVQSDGKVLFMNPAGIKLLRAPGAEEFAGKPLMDLIPPEDQESAKDELQYIRSDTPAVLRGVLGAW